jgi:hypothetical protein
MEAVYLFVQRTPELSINETNRFFHKVQRKSYIEKVFYWNFITLDTVECLIQSTLLYLLSVSKVIQKLILRHATPS